MQTADKIIYGDAVFTAKDKATLPFSGGVAIKGDTVIAVGDRTDLEPYRGEHTEVYECGDCLVMPGFNDGHMHLKHTIAATNGVPLRYVGSEEQCIKNAVAWEKEHSQYEWVFGFGWHFTHWQDKRPPDNRKLNLAFPEKPVCLADTDFHAAWLNDAALRRFGIEKGSPDPHGSVISRYPDGTPTGYVQEKIVLDLAEAAIASMEPDADTMARNFSNFLHECNRFGLTGVSDMMYTEPKWRDLYQEMDRKSLLSCRISLTQNFWDDDFREQADILAARFPDREANVWFYAVKCFYDGVGMGHTSWQIHPFYDKPDTCGEPVVPEAELYEKTMWAISTGHHVHIHACGDMSVKKALDWWEDARQKGMTKSGQRLTITHNDTVDPADIPRYAKLGVVASMQPDMLAPCLKWQDNIYPSIFGPVLSRTSWACRSFLDADTVIAFSTDAPVGLFDPMLNVYRAVTRRHADGEPWEGWIPEQKISLSNALWAYTYGSAYQFGKESFLGTLEPGKKADIAVLDKNLFAVNPEDYLGTKSKLTLLNGKVVYQK